MSGEDSTTSPDEIAVLQAYVDLINSEREAIWARHNALLVANSLIGALAISPTALWENKWAALGMISAGAIISAAWLGITLRGWGMRSCEKIRHDLLQASAKCARRDPLRSRPDEHSSPHPAGDRGLRAYVRRTGLYPPRLGLSATIPAAMRCCVRLAQRLH
jgi:hypothetical protein